MGLFCSLLKKPKKEKFSDDHRNDKLKCGDSSMQGWRLSQEDAHNCILDYDINTSFFAVYDGHGGHEVAVYCSQKLPDFIKNSEPYKAGDYEKALIESFLAFDSTLIGPEVIEQLKEIQKTVKKTVKNETSSSDVEENINNLYEEASMPLEEVIKKYTSNLKSDEVDNSEEVKVKSPKKNSSGDAPLSSGECSSQTTIESPKVSVSNRNGDIKDVESTSTNEDQSNTIQKSDGKNKETDVKAGGDQQNNNTENKLASEKEEKAEKTEADVDQNKDNEEHSPSEDNKEKKESEEVGKKRKGKALVKTKGVLATPEKKVRPQRSAQQIYNKLLDTVESETESEDEEDETFQGPIEESSSEENVHSSMEVNSEVSSDDDDDEEDDDEEEDLEEDGLDDDESIVLCDNPAFDSGCTAVVALMHKNQLYVANAGDSRCVVSRNGEAVEMSLDHTPESKEERQRVNKAGGRICSDGRINGGLNLSRALGDHSYKQNKDLSEREQMVIALPDVRIMTINPPEDEFMILACDGIWDCMSRQEVVDFIRLRLKEAPEKLSRICEELFDHCLAESGLDRGTDNMTAVIVQFLNPSCRRSPPSDDETTKKAGKRLKTDETTESTALSSTVQS